MHLLVVEAGYSELNIQATREGSQQKVEMRQKTPSFVESLVEHFESCAADLLVCGNE